MSALPDLFSKYYSLIKAVFYKKRFLNLFFAVISLIRRTPSVKALPCVVQIEPTTKCNMHCRFCLTGLNKLKRPKGDMSFDGFKYIIDMLEESIVYLVLYNLGEPLFNRHIFEMIEYAKKKNIFIRFSTNCDFEDTGNYAKIVHSGIDELVISLDCASGVSYFQHKGSNSFPKVINNIRSIVGERGRDKKPFINLQLLIMKETESEVALFKNIVRDLGVDKGIIKKVRVEFPGKVPEKNYLARNQKYVRDKYKKDYSNKICYRPWISTSIFWDGTVAPCCFDMEGDYNFGNIFNENLRKIWNNDAYISFRKRVADFSDDDFICNECSIKDFFKNFSS